MSQVIEMGGQFPENHGLPLELEIPFLRRIVSWEKSSPVNLTSYLRTHYPGLSSEPFAVLLKTLVDLHIQLLSCDHCTELHLMELLWNRIIPHLEYRPEIHESTLWQVAVDAYEDDAESVYLKYYADEDERAEWQELNPSKKLPSREAPQQDLSQKIEDMIGRTRPIEPASGMEIPPLERIVYFGIPGQPYGYYHVLNLPLGGGSG